MRSAREGCLEPVVAIGMLCLFKFKPSWREFSGFYKHRLDDGSAHIGRQCRTCCGGAAGGRWYTDLVECSLNIRQSAVRNHVDRRIVGFESRRIVNHGPATQCTTGPPGSSQLEHLCHRGHSPKLHLRSSRIISGRNPSSSNWRKINGVSVPGNMTSL